MKTVLPLWAALSVACGLCGCAHFEDRPLVPERNLDAFQTRSLRNAALLAFVRETRPDLNPSKGWRLADLTLAAFYCRPELAVARAEWAVAESEIGGALEYPNPTLGLAPAFDVSTPSDAGISSWILGASLDVPVDWPSKRKARMAEAEAHARVALLQLVSAAWETRVCVRADMLDLYAARQRAVLSRRKVEILEASKDLLTRKQQLGGTGPLYVHRSRQDLAEARLAVMDEEKREAVVLARLASTLGVPSRALAAITIDFSLFDTLPEDVPTAAVWRQALMNRADILEQLTQYQATQARLQLEISRQYPDVTIGPGYEFDQSDHKWGLSLSLTLPLFNRNQAAIETARRERDAAAARFEALQAHVLGALEQAMAEYTHSYRQVIAATGLARENEESLAIVEQQMAAGAAARMQVLEAQLAANAGAWQRLNARLDALAALGHLEQELQSPADLPGWRGTLNKAIGTSEGTHEEE